MYLGGSTSTWTSWASKRTWPSSPTFVRFGENRFQFHHRDVDESHPAGTRYELDVSTDVTNFDPIAGSSITASTRAVVSGLAQNTAYYAQVRALSDDPGFGPQWFLLTAPGSSLTGTLPLALSSPTITSIGYDSDEANWNRLVIWFSSVTHATSYVITRSPYSNFYPSTSTTVQAVDGVSPIEYDDTPCLPISCITIK